MEFSVAAVGSDEATADYDDSSGSWHFQLEVGVVWYCHEVREGWSPEDGVVLRFPVDHFKVQRLLAKVVALPKTTSRFIFPRG